MKTFLILFLVSANAFAQTTSTTLPPAAISPSNSSTAEVSTFSLDKFKSKFRVNYFSETLGPTIKKWDDNEYLDDGRRDVVPMTMYHSLTVQYAATDRFSLVVSPRLATVIGDRNDLYDTMDQHVVYQDDWQFGFLYTFVKTEKFRYSQRLTHREPFSAKSRWENIDSQIEWQHDFTYVVNPAFRIIHWNNYRYYAYNKESTIERYRINFRTLFNYTVNDKWNLQYMHELDLQHRAPKNSNAKGYRRMNYMNPYHDYSSIGIGYSPIRDLTFVPFIRAMDNKNIRNETTIVGLWILGKVL